MAGDARLSARLANRLKALALRLTRIALGAAVIAGLLIVLDTLLFPEDEGAPEES